MTRKSSQLHKHNVARVWHTVAVRRFYEEVGRRLRRARQQKGLTQKQVADAVDLSRASVANIEAGRQQFPLHMLVLFANALEVNVLELLPTDRSLIDEEIVPSEIESLPEDARDWVLRVVGSSGV